MISGTPAFNNVPHDLNLALEICKGLRPDIVLTELQYVELMGRCWDTDPNKRPTAEELLGYTRKFRIKYYVTYADFIERVLPGKQ